MSAELLPPRPCVVCETPFSPPRRPGRPAAVCSEVCRRKQIRKWERGVDPEVRARRADARRAKLNRRRQAKYQANVTSRGNKAGAADKQARIDRFIGLIAAGSLRVDAEATVGVAHNTVEQWFKRDPEVKRRYVMARDKAQGLFVPEKVAFDAEFRQKFFHHDTPAHMQALIDVINEQVAIAEREQRRDRRVLILMPPEFGKSTVAVEEYISYRIAMDPSFRSTIVCATQGKARKRIGAISRMLTDRSAYADLIDNYGPFESQSRSDKKPWTADYFTHLRAPAAQRDYTCQALGWTGDIYGDRMNLIVYDDVATLKNQTPALIEAMWDKTWSEVRTRLLKGGLFLVIGTRVREGDIYSVLEDKGFFTDKVIMPAIVREPGTLTDDDPGESLWEAGTSIAELLKIRETDLRIFELNYQQNPLPSVGAVFPHDAIEACFDDTRKIGDIPERSVVVAGIDPSVSNYTAGVVVALTRTESGEVMRYLVDVWNEKNLTGEGGDNYVGVVDFIIELCKTYHVSTLCVEDGTWMSLINNSYTLRSKLYDLGVRHVPIKATEDNVGPEAIRQLSGLFTHNLINLPGTPQSKHHLATFVNQLLTWTGERSHWRKQFDIVKAFRQAEHAVRFHARPRRTHHAMAGGYDTPAFLEEVAVG